MILLLFVLSGIVTGCVSALYLSLVCGFVYQAVFFVFHPWSTSIFLWFDVFNTCIKPVLYVFAPCGAVTGLYYGRIFQSNSYTYENQEDLHPEYEIAESSSSSSEVIT